MSLANSISRRSMTDQFGPTCPNNAKWYACAKGSQSSFVGCCSIDPCGLATGCTITNLQPVSFNASSHDTSAFPPDPDCGANDILPYSCVSPDKKNTFWGCCKSNPCKNSPPKCKDGDLAQATLKTDMQFNAFNKPSNDKSSPASGDGHHVNTGIIAGATVGGVIVVVAIVSLLVFCLCKKRRTKNEENKESASSPAAAETSTANVFSGKTDYRGSTLSDVPPVYTSPNPNEGGFVLPHHSGYDGYKGGYQQVAQGPMELSGESALSASEAAPGDFIVELPDSSAAASPSLSSPGRQNGKGAVELESPLMSPTHPVSPRKPQPRFQEVMADTKV